MSIKKTIKFTTGSIKLPPTSSSSVTYPPESVLPLGAQPEGNMDALGKLQDAMESLFKNIDELKKNLDKLTAENQRLKDALGLVESPLVLTEDMEVKDGH
jgi:hypothetical protein|tara:strand:- start:384 stop:683 length:300 start_codon:yes stop_codon:yes gene_type:complete